MRGIETLVAEGKKPPAPPKVVNPENEVGPELLAKSIVEVAAAAQKLLNGRLRRRAIIVLIQDSISGGPVARSTIEAVLDAAAGLAARYTK